MVDKDAASCLYSFDVRSLVQLTFRPWNIESIQYPKLFVGVLDRKNIFNKESFIAVDLW